MYHQQMVLIMIFNETFFFLNLSALYFGISSKGNEIDTWKLC